MKRLLFASIMLNALFIVGRVLDDTPDTAVAQAGGVATANGDVNCDGDIDVSDPVFLLVWLFGNGNQPCAFAGSPELEKRVENLETAIQSVQGQFLSLEEEVSGVEVNVGGLQSDVTSLEVQVGKLGECN